jgi:hypothetical protein
MAVTLKYFFINKKKTTIFFLCHIIEVYIHIIEELLNTTKEDKLTG